MKTTQELNLRLLRHLLRTDFFDSSNSNRGNIKAPKCTGNNHICGKVCLPPSKTCRISQAEVDKIVSEIEDQIRNRPVEYMAIVDSSNGELIGSNKGTETYVAFPLEAMTAIQSRPPGTVIITHNHPDVYKAPPESPLSKGLSFSEADLRAASMLQVKEMRAVSNGYTHSIKLPPDAKPGNWPNQNQISKAHQENLEFYKFDLYQQIVNRRISVEKAEAEIDHLAVQQTAKDLGLVYTRTPVRRAKQDSIYPKKKDQSDSLRIDATTLNKVAQKRQIEQQSRSIIGKIYKGKVIARLTAEKIQPNGSVYGLFWDKENNQFSFAIANGEVLYKLIKPARQDSLVFIEDKRTGGRKVGVKCGNGWISADYVCRKSGNQAPQQEIAALNQSAQQFAQLNSPDPGDVSEGTVPQKKTSRAELEDRTIRELQKIGRETGVVNTNSMRKEQLIDAIMVARDNPEQQARIRKTVERKREIRREVKGIPAADAIVKWKKLQRILKATGVSPELVGIASFAFLANQTRQQVKKTKDKYAQGVNNAARDAETRVKGIPSTAVEEENIMFVVGGFKGEESSAKQLREGLQGEDEKDQWFEKNNHMVEFDLQGMDIPEFVGQKKGKNGQMSLEYNAYLAANGVKQFAGNYAQGKSEDATELAAQLYAFYNHKEREPGEKGKTTFPNQNKQINILAHSAGGNVVNEALDILKQMKGTNGGVSGETVLKYVNAVNLGTPSFGFTEDFSKTPRAIGALRTITPKGDPISRISPRNPTYTSDVKGRGVDDFMQSEFVKEQLRRTFGYYRG